MICKKKVIIDQFRWKNQLKVVLKIREVYSYLNYLFKCLGYNVLLKKNRFILKHFILLYFESAETVEEVLNLSD